MGYYIKLEESNFQIKKESDKKILKIWKELNHQKNNYLKRGGSSNGQKWFSWMPENYDKTVKNCKEVLELLGFETEIENENIIITDYDQKTGQEELFLKYASKFIDNHNYLIFRGEEGEYFAYYFYEKIMNTLESDNFEDLKNSFLKFKAIEEKKIIEESLDKKISKKKKPLIKI